MDPLYWHTSNIWLIVYGYLRRNRLPFCGYSSRQPLWHNILCICLFAREDVKVNDPISWKCISMARFSVYIWCAIYTQKLTLECIDDTMVMFRGVGNVRIISTPNRNRKWCHWNALSWDQAGVLSMQCVSVYVLHSNVCAHTVREYHIKIDKRARMINFLEEAALAWSIADYSFRGTEINKGANAHLKRV